MQRLNPKIIKEAANQALAVHNCPACQAHLEAIKEHSRRGHKD